MPEVGLLSSTEPVPPDAKVVIHYSVEIDGLPVYQETYSTDTIAEELQHSRDEVLKNWARRVECVIACRSKPKFSASLTGCLADGLHAIRESSEAVSRSPDQERL